MTKQGLVFLICVLALSITAQAQEIAQLRPELRPIRLELSTESTRVCLGSFVSLELKITNHGDHEIKISKLDVWRQFSFSYVASDGFPKTIGYGIVPGRTEDSIRLRDDIFSLKPSATYTTNYRFSLLDRRYFEDSSKYTLRAYYNDVATSNIVSFETYDCNSK